MGTSKSSTGLLVQLGLTLRTSLFHQLQMQSMTLMVMMKIKLHQFGVLHLASLCVIMALLKTHILKTKGKDMVMENPIKFKGKGMGKAKEDPNIDQHKRQGHGPEGAQG
jgi:hypothetical protein